MTKNQNHLLAPAKAALALLSEYRERVIKGEITGRLLEGDYEPTAALRRAIREEEERLVSCAVEPGKLADYLLITFSDDGNPWLARCEKTEAVLAEAARSFRNSEEPFHQTEFYFHLEVFGDGALRKTLLEERDVLRALAALPLEESDDD
jgi:hypothetical protein